MSDTTNPALRTMKPEGIINGKPATAHSLLAALIDIYDDERKYAPEDRCYVEEAWPETVKLAREFLATPVQQEMAPLGFVRQVDVDDFFKGVALIAKSAEGDWQVPVYLAAPAQAAIDAREKVSMASKMEVESWRRSLLVWREASHAELIENTAGLKQCLSNAARLLLDHPSLASRDAAPAPAAAGGVTDERILTREDVVRLDELALSKEHHSRMRKVGYCYYFAGLLEAEISKKLAALAQPAPVQEARQGDGESVKLDDIEQYRMQMAGICTAAIGYWKEGESVHPDYDTLALREVAKLYAKYDALYKSADRQALIDWAVERWNAEVKYRPMVNIHRRSLDDAWRQVLRYLGVDDRERLGPTHDELRAEIGSKEWEAMNGKAAPVQQEAAGEPLRKAVEEFLFAYRAKYKTCKGSIRRDAPLLSEVTRLNAALRGVPIFTPPAVAAPAPWPMEEQPDGTIIAVDPSELAAPAQAGETGDKA